MDLGHRRTDIKTGVGRLTVEQASAHPKRPAILAYHGYILQLESGVVEIAASEHPDLPAIHPKSDRTGIGIAVAQDFTARIDTETNRILQHFGEIAGLRRLHRTTPHVDACQTVCSASGEVNACRVVRHDDIRVMAVSAIGIKPRIAGQPGNVGFYEQIAGYHLISAAGGLNPHTVHFAVQERGVFESEMTVVVDGKTRSKSVCIKRTATIGEIVLLGIHTLGSSAAVILPHGVNLDHPVHFCDSLYPCARAHDDRTQITHIHSMRKRVVVAGYGQHTACARVDGALKTRGVVSLALVARKIREIVVARGEQGQ